jgi:hypothetical protein
MFFLRVVTIHHRKMRRNYRRLLTTHFPGNSVTIDGKKLQIVVLVLPPIAYSSWNQFSLFKCYKRTCKHTRTECSELISLVSLLKGMRAGKVGLLRRFMHTLRRYAGGVASTLCCRIETYDLLGVPSIPTMVPIVFIFSISFYDRFCGLVVRVPGYRTEMYCAFCEVRTEFIYVM